jgi:hypothetical protein
VDRWRAGLPPADRWLDGGIPWAAVLLAPVLPFLLSGPIRAVTSLSLSVALALAVLVCATAARAVWPWLRTRRDAWRRRAAWMPEAAVLLPVGFAVWALYIRAFDGFPNLDGWDGGTHVVIKDVFATLAPSIYTRQVAYYGFAWWLERLFGLDAFRSFTIAFYVTVTLAVAFPFAVALAVVHRGAAASRPALAAGTVATVLGAVGALWLVILPLLHYNQAAGFYVHVFGLIPLVLLWAADVLIRLPLLRLVALLGGLAFLRYAYALNLADAALAVACGLLVEGFRGRWRLVQRLAAVGLVVAAWRVVVELRPVFHVWGGMQRFDVDRLLVADLLAIGGSALYLLVDSWQWPPRAWQHRPLPRALRFPLVFALASSALVSVLRRGQGVLQYYVTKYQMWACILLAFVLVILLAHGAVVMAKAGSWRRPRLWLHAVLLAGLLATVPPLWRKTFAGYQQTLDERMVARGPTYPHLHALADVEALARIKAILAAQHKQFGGYLTNFFPRFSFMNATLGRHTGYQEFFPPAIAPGYCVFWVTRERDLEPLGPVDRLEAHRLAVAAPGSSCVEYAVPWKATPQSLCHRCF